MIGSPEAAPPSAFPAGGGAVGALMREHDWSGSPLGSPETWPQSLRTVVELMLHSKFAMFVAWGPELGFLYNDSYAEILGAKHPQALGRRFHDIWAEIWDDISPLIDAAMAGEATYRENLPLVMNRKGFDEQTWFTFSYSPVHDENGRVAGMFCAVAETTGQVLAERAVRESEARFRNMADNAPVMMWVTDASGRATYLNRAWYEFTGQTPAEAEGFGWLDATHSDDRPEAERIFLEANASRASFRLEYRLRSADGSYRWAIDAAAPRFDEAGEFLGYVGSVIDIDERRGMEAALRESEERLRFSEARLRTLTDAVPAIVWFASPDGELHYFNERWYEYTGQSPEEALPNGWTAMLHPEDAPRTAAEWEHARAHGTSYENECRYLRKDGSYRWHVARAEPLRGADGVVTGWFGTSTDIHDRKRAEQRLRDLNENLEQRVAEAVAERREADALYQAYFENSPEALFVIGVDPDGSFVAEQINPAHEAGVGFRLADVRGKKMDTFLPPDMAERILSTYRQVVESGDILHYRETWELNGEPQHWDTSLVPVRDGDGRITRIIGSSRNVSRQVLAEDALRQSQKMEAMGQLTGGVAHDFNNLLAPIVGGLDMLQRKGIGGEREQRLISGAMQSAERARTLVQRLLAFARRQPLQPVPVDIAALITGMGELIASTTGPQIQVAVEAADDLRPAMADPNQLEMALLNLAVNARDAMPGGGTLRISARNERIDAGHRTHLSPGLYICLSVADTGSGMDEATLARAVEPFFSTKGVGKGTGLGLSMAHGLASQLGGALTIQSRIGLGTNVELWLPESKEAPDVADASTELACELPKRGTALLVDDEELVRMSTADMLTDLGYAVLEAGSAEEALRLAEQGKSFDLLLTDHLMPGMNGDQLARAIRSLRPNVPVLLVSGYAESEGIAPDLPRLTKPFRKDELATSLAQLAMQDGG